MTSPNTSLEVHFFSVQPPIGKPGWNRLSFREFHFVPEFNRGEKRLHKLLHRKMTFDPEKWKISQNNYYWLKNFSMFPRSIFYIGKFFPPLENPIFDRRKIKSFPKIGIFFQKYQFFSIFVTFWAVKRPKTKNLGIFLHYFVLIDLFWWYYLIFKRNLKFPIFPKISNFYPNFASREMQKMQDLVNCIVLMYILYIWGHSI